MAEENVDGNGNNVKRRKVDSGIDDKRSASSDSDITSPDNDALAFSYIVTGIVELDKESFIIACNHNNVKSAKKILQLHPDSKNEFANSLIKINAADPSIGKREVSLLFRAAQIGNIDTVKFLLKIGANPNQVTTDIGATALMTAAYNGHPEVATLLLDHGADPNQATTDNGETALMWAAESGHAEVATLLLDRGAKPNLAATDDGTTALMWAAQNSHLDIARLLLNRGADPNQEATDNGATPLMLAAENGHLEVARLLLDRGAKPNLAATDNGETALMLAAQNSHLDIARLLLNSGADPNQAATDNGTTALMWAAQNGHTQNVDILLAYGARSQLRGQLQPLPNNLLQSLKNPAAIFNAQRIYPDKVAIIGTEEARRELNKLKALVTVADGFGIPKLKPYQPGDVYKTYAIHSAKHAFKKAKDKGLDAEVVALATYFNLMNYRELISTDLTYEILNYKDAVAAGDGQEIKDIPSIAEVISIVQQEIVQQRLTHKKRSDEKTGIFYMPTEILDKILDFYASMAPRQEVYRRQNKTLITTINSSLATIFAPDSAEIISDTIAKAAKDRLQLPEQVIRSVKESIGETVRGVIEKRKENEKIAQKEVADTTITPVTELGKAELTTLPGKKSIAGTVQAAVTETVTAPSMSTYTGRGDAAAGVGTRAVETSATTSSATNEPAGAAAPYPTAATASTSSSSSATRSDGMAADSPATNPASPIATESRSTSSTTRGL